MLIGEVAEHIGASTRSLRHYEQQGLISPSREHNGYRVYGTLEVIRAGNVKDLLDLGLTTDDVRQYLAEGCLDAPLGKAPRCAAELETVHHRLQKMDVLIARLQSVRERLAEHAETVESQTRPR